MAGRRNNQDSDAFIVLGDLLDKAQANQSGEEKESYREMLSTSKTHVYDNSRPETSGTADSTHSSGMPYRRTAAPSDSVATTSEQRTAALKDALNTKAPTAAPSSISSDDTMFSQQRRSSYAETDPSLRRVSQSVSHTSEQERKDIPLSRSNAARRPVSSSTPSASGGYAAARRTTASEAPKQAENARPARSAAAPARNTAAAAKSPAGRSKKNSGSIKSSFSKLMSPSKKQSSRAAAGSASSAAAMSAAGTTAAASAQRPTGTAASRTSASRTAASRTASSRTAAYGTSRTAARSTAGAATSRRGTSASVDNRHYNREVYIAEGQKPKARTQQPAKRSGGAWRNPTKNMNFQQKVKYYLSQIGPTVKAIQADPRRREAAYRIIIILVALLLATYMTSCMNDIMGFSRSDKEKTVSVQKGMSTNQLISALDKAGLIKHSLPDKLFIKMTSGIRGDADGQQYLTGEYILTPSMGLEKMLDTCTAVQKHQTVEITFPEGYTARQMARLLEKNKVCSQEDFLGACRKTNYKYKFIKDMPNKDQRYILLEGYLYPDTYEFYVGEDAHSVVDKILSNFNEKWSSTYESRADELNMSVDDVMTLASLVQKEDSNADNMKLIASVFYNRLNSSAFPSLQSDTTSSYLNRDIKPYVSSADFQTFKSRYSTYVCTGLPVGPISSVGDNAIKAVLWPESTSYYYFVHDSDGNIHMARTNSEQDLNVYNALTVGSSSDDDE